MAGPITWQNVAAPNFSDALRARESASRGMDAAFTGFQDIIKARQATDTANWEQGAKNNTAEFLAAVRQPKNAAEFQALQQSGALDQQRQGFGAQINQEVAANALDTRLGTLQGRDKAGIEYQNIMADSAAAPVIEAYKIAMLKGDKAGADAIAAANPTIRGLSGALDFGHGITQRGVTEERATTTFNNGVTAFGTDQMVKKNADTRGAAELVLRQEAAKEAERNGVSLRNLHGAQAGAAGANASLARLGIAQQQFEQSQQERERKINAEAFGQTTYGAGEYNTPKGDAVVSTALKDVGYDPAQINSLHKKIGKLFPNGIPTGETGKNGDPLYMPIPAVFVAEAAKRAGERMWGAWDNRGDNAANILKEMVEAPGAIASMQRSAQLKNDLFNKPRAPSTPSASAYDAAIEAAKKKLKQR